MDGPAHDSANSSLAPGFRLGELRILPKTGEAIGPAATERLDPKVMGVLVMLAERTGQVVSRDELIAKLWPGVVVGDEVLSRCIYELRRQLDRAGGGGEIRTLIETLPKRGFRLNAEVVPLETSPGTTRRDTRRRFLLAGLAVGVVALVIAIATHGSRTAARPPSIAVLPFSDLSETQDQAYLADGLAEEILDALSQSTDLRVIARTSSFAFRGQNADIGEIARRLDVTYVLEGSVRRSGDSLRVTSQLIATSDSSHVWSTTFERKLGDLFAIQDEIAAAVASSLKATLARAGKRTAPPPQLAAYDLAKQGEYFYYRRGPGDVERSIELFERAVKIDPGYARAWADLAGAYSMLAWSVDPPPAALRARQGDAALRAVELDPSSVLAQARLAQYYGEAGDEENHRKHFDVARQLDPNHPLVLAGLASDAIRDGDYAAAIALVKRALLRDPMNSVTRQMLGAVYIAAGQYEHALRTYREVLEINPDAGLDCEVEIPRLLVLQGHLADAAAAALGLPAGKYRDQAMALLQAAPENRAAADAALTRLVAAEAASPAANPQESVMGSVRLAEIYAFRNRSDEAFRVLDAKDNLLSRSREGAAYQWYLRHEARLSPFLKVLHSDPRWAAFVNDSA